MMCIMPHINVYPVVTILCSIYIFFPCKQPSLMLTQLSEILWSPFVADILAIRHIAWTPYTSIKCEHAFY